ncbi:MAG: tRNA m5C48-49 methylase [Hydrogenibacillus schlegelii]|uniref:tRNA m5C48-49 methylase n=1 Tax=Hydrogenibacillus schlegelii TaxID=1484 RepID=A0A2T5G597_HYDSH|nr:RsmB/NOP family class I SAM-dependent RNA methyltransferase [Hydrogenibacillus schlegelii]PTQ51348.1 MAG: tRNA m5C48-49 methylase [Hydrogenibacillus schlegelii]
MAFSDRDSLFGLERYRPIVDDWEAFRAALFRPQPATIRANALKTTPEALRRALEALGFALTPAPFDPALFTIDASPIPPGKTVLHWLGHFYVQEAAAALPVLALAPEPEERVLDLAAAPGGKTTQIAERMGDRGLVVGNDPDGARLQSLLANVYRLGTTAVAVTRQDGRRLSGGRPFDRVLVDAPCTAEGNVRRRAGARRTRSPGEHRRIAALQTALLERGVALARDGGVVVYSTCTFAPEENEAVVDAVVRKAGGAVRIESLPEGLPGVPGLEAWEGARYVPEMVLTRRIYPHHLDSGGMYIARLRRLAPPPWADRLPPSPGARGAGLERPDPALVRALLDGFRDRFGLPPTALEGLTFFVRGGDVWATRLADVPDGPELVAAGIRLFRLQPGEGKMPSPGPLRNAKPTSFALLHFAQEARANVADVDAEALLALLEGRRIAPPAAAALERGFVALRFRGTVIGLGHLDADGLRSGLPRGRAEDLRAALLEERALHEAP